MSRKFIAVIVASSIALTTLTASPSFAGSRDRDKALMGIAGLILLGTAIANASNRDDHRDGRVERPHRPRDVRPTVRRTHPEPRPLPRRVSRYELPSQCLISVRSRHGSTRFLSERCLNKHYRATHHLPRQCVVQVNNRGHKSRGYAARCLKRFGYRMSRR